MLRCSPVKGLRPLTIANSASMLSQNSTLSLTSSCGANGAAAAGSADSIACQRAMVVLRTDHGEALLAQGVDGFHEDVGPQVIAVVARERDHVEVPELEGSALTVSGIDLTP